ncbi:hypothetical protein VST7929_02652 [Vibrio stylophorae]|uniref:MobA-like NTP transferase domain-containing protein n=1 Tax=Vibrio stylophorae TaxID=659351 RepID=A0ABN8DZ90_9VIBR|nr:NTP transferase domain-containing protein [Vibrio stylophorae]CAH0534702.1 hypothetical protein VST7929_02652 [Vibrio stylophorae]
MSSIEHVVIAAAGLGSRLGLGKPKCLLEIGGKPLISYLLKLVESIKDVRIVVGFEEHLVIPLVKSIRSDAIIVRNPAYRTTSTLTSYYLGSFGIKGKCLYVDADIIFCPESFAEFIDNCNKSDRSIIGVTKAKTDDAVYVKTDLHMNVLGFNRKSATNYEWANICHIDTSYLVMEGESVYKQIQKFPLIAYPIVSYEVDNVNDYNMAIESKIYNHKLYQDI